EARVAIIEPGYKTEGNDVVFGTVNPGTAILVEGEWIAHGVDDFAGSNAAGGNFPELLYAHAVSLRVACLVQLEASDELLSQRAARAFGEDHYFRAKVVAGFKVTLLFAALVHAFVVGTHSNDSPLLEKQLRAGKSREDGYARLFDLA